MNVTGNANLAGDVTNVSSVNVSGTTRLAANVSTTGNQTYTGAMTLGRDVTLSTNGSNAVITTGSTVNSDTTARSMTVYATGANSQILLASATGGIHDLNDLSLTASGISLNGGTVNTSGNQSYNGSVTLGANTQLTRSGDHGLVTFNGTVNSDSTPRSLTVNANGSNSTLNIQDSVGANQALSSFTNTATTTLIGNALTRSAVSIKALNDLQFSGTVELQSPTHIDIATVGSLTGHVVGSQDLFKEGVGTLLLSQANSFSGATQVKAGTLAVSNDQGLGANTAPISVVNGAVLDLQGVTVGAKPLTLQGGTLGASNGNSSWAGPVLISADSRMDVSGQKLTVSGMVDASQAGLALTGTGSVVLSNTSNTVSRLATASSTTAIDLNNSTPMTIGSVSTGGVTYTGVKSTGGITLISSAPTTVAPGSSVASTGGDIVLETSQFINQAGASALSTSASNRWQVWSTNPNAFVDATSGDSLNTLNNNFVYYNARRDSLQNVPTGNGLFYAYAPVAVASLTGTVVRNYDGTANAYLTDANYAHVNGVRQLSGAQDVLTLNNPTNGLYVSPGTGATAKDAGSQKDVQVTGLVLTATQDGKPVYGYTFVNSVRGNVGEIKPAPLDLAFSKVYEGNNRFDSTNFYTLTGMVGSEASPLINAGMATVASSNAGVYNQFTSTNLSLNNPNYTLVGGTQMATIQKAPLGIAINTLFKAKTDLPDIAAKDFTVVGLQNGETIPKIDVLSLAYKDVSRNEDNYVKSITISSGAGVADMANYVITQAVNKVPKASDGGNTMNMVKLISPDEVVTFPAAPPPTLPVVSAPAPAPAPVYASAREASINQFIPGMLINIIVLPTPQTTGLVTVMLPQGSTDITTTGLVIALPEAVISSATTPSGENLSVNVTLPNNQPLPAWIRYDASQKALVTSADATAMLPITVLITIGDRRTVVVISESLQK
jgi:autotransporter-associated beta strand protein